MYNLKINNNGDSLETISHNLAEAKKAVISAQASLSRCLPHGRNYQTVENGLASLAIDREIHYEYMDQLNKIVRELEDTQLRLLRDNSK